MKYRIMNKVKKKFQSPQISEVRIDHEISLVLVSSPPDGPYEGMGNKAPEHFNQVEDTDYVFWV